MDDDCIKLELELSHPALDVEEHLAASSAVDLFRKERETLFADPETRTRVHQRLHNAVEEVESLLRLYSHLLRINGLLSEYRPSLLKAHRETAAKAHWDYGYGLAHDEPINTESTIRPVRLAHGLDGWECLLKARSKSNWAKQHLHHSDRLSFMDRPSRPSQHEAWPENEYSSDHLVTIVGFRLSCNNGQGQSVQFTVSEGGILKSSLMVNVTAPYGCEWHCRVYFVGYKLGELASRLVRVDS